MRGEQAWVSWYVRKAEVAYAHGHRREAVGALQDASNAVDEWKAAVDGLGAWPEWERFRRACVEAADRPRWLFDDPLRRSLGEAKRNLTALSARSEGTEVDAAERSAKLGESLEDILDAVWAAERDWAFDDRLAIGTRWI